MPEPKGVSLEKFRKNSGSNSPGNQNSNLETLMNLRTTLTTLAAFAVAFIGHAAEAQPGKPNTPTEKDVYNFHLQHPGGVSSPGDPNAAFYLDGV